MDGRYEVAFIRVFAAIKPVVVDEAAIDASIFPSSSATQRTEKMHSFELELPLRQNANI